MEHLPKETLLTIINDLNNQISEKNNLISDLNKTIEELAKPVLPPAQPVRSDDTNSVSSDDTNTNKWNMSFAQKKNMMKFLKEQCVWCDEDEHKVIDWRDGGIYEVAPSSVRDLHAHFRKWAQANEIKTKGENRGIPVEPDFKRYLVSKHKQRFSHIPWRCSESNQFPKFYNGSHSTPRISLKIKE